MPGLQRYSSVLAQTASLVDMTPLADCLMTVSLNAVRLHAASGLPSWTYPLQVLFHFVTGIYDVDHWRSICMHTLHTAVSDLKSTLYSL